LSCFAVTVPPILPVVTCAMSAGAIRTQMAANTTADLFKLDIDPPEALLSDLQGDC
jgi:hypothetical protein